VNMPGECAGRQGPRLFAILESVAFRVVFLFASQGMGARGRWLVRGPWGEHGI